MTDAPIHNAAPSQAKALAEGPPRPRKVLWIVALLLIVGMAVLAWFRVGMLDLPAVPGGLTLKTAGLRILEARAERGVQERVDLGLGLLLGGGLGLRSRRVGRARGSAGPGRP